MFDFFKQKNLPLVGIDISSTAVKLIELAESHGTYEVISYGVEFLPAESMEKREIKDPVAVGEAIKKAMARARSRAKFATIAMTGSTAITKIIQMNSELTDQELEDQITVEADQYIPFPIDEIEYDFAKLGPSEDEGYVDVLLAACHKDQIESRLDALEIAGLKAKIVDLEVYAMERAFSLIQEQITEGSEGSHSSIIALVDIGSTSTTLQVMENKKTIFSREQDFGGKTLIDTIQSAYELSFEEAIIAKRDNDLPEGYTQTILEPFRASTAAQVNRAIQFFFSSTDYNFIDKIFLAGGTSTIEGLVEEIEQQTEIPTVIANPFADMMVSSNVNAKALVNDAPALMLGCGLALRTFD